MTSCLTACKKNIFDFFLIRSFCNSNKLFFLYDMSEKQVESCTSIVVYGMRAYYNKILKIFISCYNSISTSDIA